MGFAWGTYTGRGRDVSCDRTPIPASHIPERVLGDLCRTPKMIMWAGVVILVLLGLTSGIFGGVGLLIILFGACLHQRRRVAADRYYAQARAEQDISHLWRSVIATCGNSGERHTVQRAGAPPSGTATMTGESPAESGRLGSNEAFDTVAAPHSDAA